MQTRFWQGQRTVTPQLLNEAAPHEARQSLADIVFLNRWLGGHRVIRYLFRHAAPPKRAFTVLDVGAASGDSGAVIRGQFPLATVISLDKQALNLEAAETPKLVGDAFSLPFADASIDYVFCSLFLHHFSEEQVVELLCEFARVATRAVLISDVERQQLARWFLPATRWLCRWHPLTVHDGAVSVQSAFTRKELLALAQKTPLRNVSVATHRPAFRLSLIGWIKD